MFLYLGTIWALGLGIIWALFGHYLGTRLGSVVEASAGLRRELNWGRSPCSFLPALLTLSAVPFPPLASALRFPLCHCLSPPPPALPSPLSEGDTGR